MAIGWAANNTGGAPSGPAGGDLDGTYPDPTVDGLQGEPVSADAPALGDVLTFDGSEWGPAAPTGGAPTGAASGDLGGTYPGPAVVALQGVAVANTAPTNKQVLAEDGAGEWLATTLDVTYISGLSTALADKVDDNGGTANDLALTGSPTSTTPAANNNTTRIATTAYVQTELIDFAPLASPTFAGDPKAPTPTPGDNDTSIATTAFVTDALATGLAAKVNASGGTLTGGTLSGTTSVPLAQTLSIAGSLTASGATSVTVPTVAFPDSDTSAASTAFVSVNFAPINSPSLTGSPTSTTPPAGDNDTSIATTAFVQGEITSTNAVSRQLQFSSYFDDFICSTPTTGDLTWHGSNSGANSSLSANGTALATVDGYRFIDSGTAATGFSRISKAEVVAGQGSFFSPWTEGNIELIWRVRMQVLPVIGSNPSAVLGFGNGSLSASTVGTAGIVATFNANNANWILASREANLDVVTATATIGLTAAVWQTVIMRITSVSAMLYAGATYATAIAAGVRATVTMVGATTTAVSQYTKLVNLGAVAAEKAIELDFCGFEFSRTLSR